MIGAKMNITLGYIREYIYHHQPCTVAGQDDLKYNRK